MRRPRIAHALSARWIVALALAALALAATPAHADDLDDLAARAQVMSEQLSELDRQIHDDLSLHSASDLEARIQEGQVLMELGDPTRASVIFLDIVEREEWRGRPGFARAHLLLAQALHASGHNHSARKWLQLTLDEGDSADRQLAAALLIELSIEMRNELSQSDWEELEQLYLQIERSGAQRPELLYARGKGLYIQGRYEEALRAFGQIDPASDLGLAARYFSGVTRARLDQYRPAIADFETVVEQGNALPPSADRQEYIELAHIGKARLHFELGEHVDAIDTYQYVPRTSPHFDQVLFEITWTQIAQGDNEMALRTLDILLLSHPDSIFMPDAKRLRADLLKEVGEYDRAIGTYEELLGDFEPVLLELEQMLVNQPDPVAYFQQRVAEDRIGAAQFLPQTATRWVEPGPQIQNASRIVNNLGQSYLNMEESEVLIDEIEAAIASENRYQLFPELREVWTHAITLEGRNLALRRDLIEAEARLLLDDADPQRRADYEAARQERLELQQRFEALPRDREAFVQRSQALRRTIAQRQLRTYRLRTLIEGALAQIDTMERWLLVQRRSANFTTQEEGRLRDQLATARSELAALEGELHEVEKDLRVQDTLGGFDASLVDRESEIRKAFKLALLREREILAPLRASADLGVADTVRDHLDRLDAGLDNLRANLARSVDGRLAEINSRLAVEKNLLDRYTGDYDRLQGDVQLVVGEIAYHHWIDVHNTFSDLVLAADMGVLDVAWLEKDATSRQLDQLREERRRVTDVLRQDFEQVLRESGDLR